ncbi:MAG: aminoacyl--tRNA ligase-related protein [Planctomycetota bacterium]
MKQMFSNATVMWDERDLVERESLIAQCVQIVSDEWTGMNRAVRFRRVETPTLTPASNLAGHIAEGFPMLDTKRGMLRPETTAGCIAAFHSMFPMSNQRAKNMPYCIWQFGKSYRDEERPDTMRASKLRLVEFHQLEFELFADAGTRADYIGKAIHALSGRFGGEILDAADDLPHYSKRTLDWHINGLEVAGCSERTDWPEGLIFEVSIGIDRLLAVLGLASGGAH